MSIVPEYVIQQVLVSGIRKFREDGSLVSMLFRNLNQDDVNGLIQFIRNETVDIALNWPNTEMKVPAIIISLKNETESQAFLGELLQSASNIFNTGTPFRKEKLTAPATTLGSGSLGQPGIEEFPLEIPISATQASSSTVRFLTTSPFNFSDPFELRRDEELLLVVREGTGAGQRRAVSSITPISATGETEVVVTSNWATVPDNTSVVEFQLISNLGSTGEPTKLFEPDQVVERLGSHYSASYQILVVGPNQELTIFLYALVKAIFIINLKYLQRHGFIEPRLGGTDFVAKPEYLPDLAYQRALILEFQHSFDVYLTPEVIREINIGLSVSEPDVGDSSGVSRVVSETTLDLS